MKDRTVPWLTLGGCVLMVLLHAVSELEAAGIWTPWPGADGVLDERLRLVRFGARSSALVADAGEVWRIYSCHLVHTGWTHLIFNLAFLFPTAGAIESIAQRRDFVALMLFVATSSGLFSLAWTPEISAGASGLVFGSLTAAVLVGLRHQHRLPRSLRPYVGLWVLPFLLIVLAAGIGNPAIDHASHLGGLVGGAVAGPWVRLAIDRERASPAGPWVGVATAAGATALALLAARPMATSGARPSPYRVASRVELDAPPTFVPRLDPLGNVVFQGRSRLVRVSVDVVPSHERERPLQWAERHRLRPLVSAGLLESEAPVADGATPVTAIAQDACVAHDYRRSGHPIQLDLCVLEVEGQTVVVGFETPREWAPKYRETRDRLLGSIRASHSEPAPSVPTPARRAPV